MSTISGFAGFNSGLPIDDIVSQLIAAQRTPIDLMEKRQTKIKSQQAAYTQVQSKVSDLLTAIKKITTRNFDGTSIFDNMTASSSDDSIATASVTPQAAAQTLSLEVVSLPSSTKAYSRTGISNFSAATELNTLGITDGNFTVTVNGVSHTFTVDASAGGDTVGDVMTAVDTQFAEITGASIVDGKIQFTYDTGAPPTVIFGAGADTSNFLAKTKLNTAVNDSGAGTLTSSQRISTIDLSSAAVGGTPNTTTAITSGSFTINGVTFSTQKADLSEKTIQEIIDEINASSAANVTASFNTGNDTFKLVSKDTGTALISLEDASTGLAGGSNFLTAMGLIEPGGNTANSQDSGTNAQFTLNGVTMYATSSTVDETVTGLSGVTLDLKAAQPGSTIQISIGKDTESLKTAISDVIEKYNAAITYIDQQTDSQNAGTLAGETRLKSLRQQIRSMFTTSVAGLNNSAYSSLQMIGISTGAVGSSGGTATAQLQFDSSKLEAALADDPSTVEKLFVAQNLGGAQDGSSADDEMDGIFTQLFHLLADTTYVNSSGNTSFGALYDGPDENSNGFFAAYQDSATKRLSALDKSITDAEARLELRRKALYTQYLAMDKMVGQYQSQGNALQNLISQLTANSKS